MDSKHGTVAARWVRAVALSLGLDPNTTTIEMARDIASVNNNILSISEFVPNA